MLTRRRFSRAVMGTGFAALTSSFWKNSLMSSALAQSGGSSPYKALVVVTMGGGNDSNNMVVPIDKATYAQYSSLRTSLALPQSQCNVLSGAPQGMTLGLHPSLVNVAKLYNTGQAAIVANVGPLQKPATKAQILANPQLLPEALLSHPAGMAQWESATTQALPATGWGGRIADVISGQSGQLPPVFNVGSAASIFTVGQYVQGIVIQSSSGSWVPLPSGINSAIQAIAAVDSASPNNLVAQAGLLRSAAIAQQILLGQAQSAGQHLQTVFPSTSFGQQLQTIAQVMAGRSVIGASRQIFYCQQDLYDTHANQLSLQGGLLSRFDEGIAAFMLALQELGLTDQVLLCTHSDFNRTMTANVNQGSDHAWGTHQIIIGGGIKGGKVLGNLPSFDLGGSDDFNGYGTWIPSLSATQMTAGIGYWMGLNSSQVTNIFPDLANFPSGALILT